jgi:antitoxin ParD1/3/4
MPISAELGHTLERYVTELVSEGRYNSKSEVLREGVRLVQEREARLKLLNAALDEGLADVEAGRLVDADAVLEQLGGKYSAMVKAAQK